MLCRLTAELILRVKYTPFGFPYLPFPAVYQSSSLVLRFPVPRFPVSRFQSPKLFIIAGFVDSLDACADAVVAKCPDRMHAGAVMLWPIRLSVCLISNELKNLPGP